MAGYSDTRQLIIDTLMGRPTGTEIQPEDHQAFALALNDYIRSVELVAGSSVPIAFAEPDTVPVQPNNGQAAYLSYVPRSATKNFVNFINQSGNSISVTSSSGEVKLVTLLWNGSYWSTQIVTIDVLSDDSSVNASNIGASDYILFSDSSNYSIGDIVRYDGKLYKFTAEHVAGAWIGTDVELASINSILTSKLTKLENKTSTVYNDNNVKGVIIITDDSANISKVDELDSIAYENLTYRDIFETNDLLGIEAGFENGNYNPLIVSVGTPEITTEDTDSGVYSLKIDGTQPTQLKTSSKFPVGLYFYACRAKCTRHVTGKLGVILGSNAAGLTSVTQDYKTCVNSFNIFNEDTYRFFIGSMDSADLTGYIDTPVIVNSSIFTEIPTINKFTELYNNYVSIKKYSETTTELVTLETKKSNRITVLSENIGEEVGYISLSDGLYHNASNYYQGELIDISSIKGEYIKLIPRTGISDTNLSAFTLLKDNILQDREAPNFADNWGVQALVSPTELLIPSDANYLWVYTYRDSAKYIYVAPYIEIPTKYALSVLWKKQHPLYTYTDALNEFISEMNAKASRLGMTSTRFTSPSGLDTNSSTANYSTAKDMLKLMIEALSYPRLMKVWGLPSWTMKVYGARARNIELESTVTNPVHDPNLAILLNNYNILGGKTGSITIEGVAYYNYCVIAEKNNKFIAATLYKASSSSRRYLQMKTLLDNAFGLLSDSSYTTSVVNAKCACCELPKVPTSILQNHLPPLIYSEGENDNVFIASTTKIMTCIIACEVLKNIDQLYYVKTDDVGGSGDDLNPGDISSFEDMMMDTMLPSSNGCAHCIARITGNVLLEHKKYM